MKQIKVYITAEQWADKRLQIFCAKNYNSNVKTLDEVIKMCGFELIESKTKPEQSQPSEIPTDKVEADDVSTGYFTEKGERVKKGAVYTINYVRYWIVEECVGNQCKFIALDYYGKKHQLHNLFPYKKP